MLLLVCRLSGNNLCFMNTSAFVGTNSELLLSGFVRNASGTAHTFDTQVSDEDRALVEQALR